MKVLADRHFNLPSKSATGGLVHVPRRRWTTVSDDVADESGFQDLVDNGHIVIAKESTPLLVEEVDEDIPEDDGKEEDDDKEDNEDEE